MTVYSPDADDTQLNNGCG